MSMGLFDIYVMNLGTEKGGYFTVSSLEELAEACRQVNPLGHNDIELQLIDCYIDVYKIGFEVEEFLQIYNDYSIDEKELAYLFVTFTASEVREVLENQTPFCVIQEDSPQEAFREYIMEHGLLEIPDHLEPYIDWNKLLIDWECGGLRVKKVGTVQGSYFNKYLIIQHF